MKQKFLSLCLAATLGGLALSGWAGDDGKVLAPTGIVKSDDHSTVARPDDDKVKAATGGSAGGSTGSTGGGSSGSAGGTPGTGSTGSAGGTVGGGSTGSAGGTPGSGSPGSAGGTVGSGSTSTPKTVATDDHPFVPLVNPPAGSVDFGAVQTGGASVSQVVMVSNGGAGPVTYTGFGLSNVSPGATFSVVARASGAVPACVASTPMAPGAACALAVTFQPAAGAAGAGRKTAVLMPAFVAPGPLGQGSINGASPGAKLAGSGVLPSGGLSIASLSFLVVGPGHDAVPQTVAVANTGLGALTFVGAAVDSSDSRFGRYSVTALANGATPACTPGLVLAVGASCSLQLGYHGTLIGTAKGRLLVDLGGGAGRPTPLELTAQTTLATGMPKRN